MFNPPPQDELAGTEQPFVAHLVELRDRIIKAFIAVAVAGLALAMVHGVVGQSGGHVSVSSTPPQGATFGILLRRAEVPTEAPDSADVTAG